MKGKKTSSFTLILILGVLTTVSPFSIDMYLPAFPQMATALHTTVGQIALSLSSYFVGLAVGQICYGPFLDRYGRKPPLYVGLILYILACVGCLSAQHVEALITFRFLQALGGCVAQVASIAMVRDFFPEKERAKVFSMLMLIVGVSPLFAPTVGSLVTTWLSWHWVFIILGAIVLSVLLVSYFILPEGHEADPTISLKPGPIFKNFKSILHHPQFYTYALSGAFSFAGLLVYVAGSPIIFMGIFHVSAETYGAIFALLSVGFVLGSQLNIQLAKHYQTGSIYFAALAGQASVGSVFLITSLVSPPGLGLTIALLALYLSFLGVTYPNASALALAPFGKNAGSASALMGSLQIGIAALASAGVGIFDSTRSLPIVSLLMGTGTLGFVVLIFGKQKMIRAGETVAPAIS